MAPRTTEGIAIDDPFEDFQVESGSEKDFLISNLREDAPKDEVEILDRARRSLTPVLVEYRKTKMTGNEFKEVPRTAQVSDRECGSQDWLEFGRRQQTLEYMS